MLTMADQGFTLWRLLEQTASSPLTCTIRQVVSGKTELARRAQNLQPCRSVDLASRLIKPPSGKPRCIFTYHDQAEAGFSPAQAALDELTCESAPGRFNKAVSPFMKANSDIQLRKYLGAFIREAIPSFKPEDLVPFVLMQTRLQMAACW